MDININYYHKETFDYIEKTTKIEDVFNVIKEATNELFVKAREIDGGIEFYEEHFKDFKFTTIAARIFAAKKENIEAVYRIFEIATKMGAKIQIV